jgi:NAD(P)H-dependent FMN reductase/ketosteroid isomerase-like protein
MEDFSVNDRINLGVIVGSLRQESWSRKLAKALIERAPERVACRTIEIGDLPLYNEDLDTRPPAAWTKFRAQVGEVDALLFITPEYNRSIPGCLKNALDVGSRPEGANAFDGIPAGVVSCTPYQMGAFGANHALRQTFVFLNMPLMQQPEAYIGRVDALFGDKGQVSSTKTDKILIGFMASLVEWIQAVRRPESVSFDAFMEERERISNAYISGDAKALHPIVTESDPATFFPPDGTHASGAATVRKSYDAGAKAFGPGSTGKLDVYQQGSDGNLAFWTGLQIAKVHMKGKSDPVAMTLRTTEVFRFEKGGWKLVHRHADFVKESSDH